MGGKKKKGKPKDTRIQIKDIEIPAAQILPPSLNPFSYKTPIGPYEALKMFFMTFTFVPVRLVLGFICFALCCLFAALSVLGLRGDAREEPLSKCRRALQWPAAFFMRAFLFVIGYYYIRTKGKPAKGINILTVAPHSSFVDAAAMMALLWPAAVAKKEISKIPLIATVVRATQTLLVDRDSHDSKHKLIADFKARADDPRWPHLLIFPEGTCTNRESLITFKAGAFIPGKPVQPVVIRYPHYFFDPANLLTGPGQAMWTYRLNCQFISFMTVEYLEPIYPTKAEKENAMLYGMRVRKVMADALDVPVTDHTYEDIKLQMAAAKLHLPPDKAVIEFGALDKLYNFSLDDIKEMLVSFSSKDRNRDGAMDLQEFADFLNLPVSDAVERTFQFFDLDHDGVIDFREFIIVQGLLNNRTDRGEVLEYAFRMFGPDTEHEEIDRESFSRLMRLVFPNMAEADCYMLFDMADTDKSGTISFAEFQRYGEKHPEYVQVFLAWNGIGFGSSSSNSKNSEYDDSSTGSLASA